MLRVLGGNPTHIPLTHHQVMWPSLTSIDDGYYQKSMDIIYPMNTLLYLAHQISPKKYKCQQSSQTLWPWNFNLYCIQTRIFTAPSAFRSFPNNCQPFGAYKMADMLTCVSVFRVDNASTAFHHSPGGWAAELFMAFPFMACCSVSHELLAKIPDSYYEPLKPMRLHLLWHNIHITSLVLDHMESSLLNLA